MSLSTFFFQFEEAGKNIKRNGLMSLAALSIVMIAMAVLGSSLYALYRLHQFADAQPKQMEMEVFLAVGTERPRVLEVRDGIAAIPGVEHASLFTREKAWEALGNTAAPTGEGLGDALNGENPLPDRIDVKLSDPSETPRVAAVLRNRKKFPDIHAVLDAREDLDKLLRFNRMVKNIGGIAAIALFLATSLVIQNTIRLTVFARRKEIRIMQLVGATAGFIRMPMILEGVFYGTVGAAAAAGLVLLLANQISAYTGSLVSPLTQNLPSAIAPVLFLGILLAVGVLVGWLGSVLSLRRFLTRV
jgi:cell division transport system permease protein